MKLLQEKQGPGMERGGGRSIKVEGLVEKWKGTSENGKVIGAGNGGEYDKSNCIHKYDVTSFNPSTWHTKASV